MNKSNQNIIAGIGITALLAFTGIAAGLSSTSLNQQTAPNNPKSTTTNIQETEQNSSNSTPKPEAESPKPKIEVKTETSTRTIPYETKYVDDNNTLAKGSTKVTTAGVNGVETTTYEVTYTDGKETSRKTVKVEVTKKPVTEIIARGTYVKPQTPTCPNGTYVNSAGNTVCRPAASSSQPAGATALCRDGTYSYSQSRRGTCSHHGGVSRWL